MNNNIWATRVNYLFVFLTINYGLFSRFIIHIDSGKYGLIALSVLVLVMAPQRFKTLQNSKPIKYWLIWCIYAFLNYYLHPHVVTIDVFALYRRIFIPLIVMTVVALEYEKCSSKLLWLCLFTASFHMVFGYYFDPGILFRIDDEDRVLGNSYAITSSFVLFYSAILNRKNKIKTPLFAILAVIAMIVLAMSGTRKAFGAGAIFLAFWIFSDFNFNRIRTWVTVALLLYAGYLGYNQLMENTFIGQRMELIEEQGEDNLPPDAPQILQVFGDRASHYYYGWKKFLDYPFFGVGTGQSRIKQTSTFVDMYLYTHTEYITQLSDQGIVGFILFLMFYYWIAVHVIKAQRLKNATARCMLGGLVGLLFFYLTAWAWEFPYYFICLGVLIGYCRSTANEVSICRTIQHDSYINYHPKTQNMGHYIPYEIPFPKWAAILLSVIAIGAGCYVVSNVIVQDKVEVGAVQELAEEAGIEESLASEKPVAKEEPEWEKYNKMDSRLSGGSYYIMGLDRIVKARAGDNAEKIAKRVYGRAEGCCYIEVYNGIKATTELEEGREIKIPKLESKQAVRKRLKQQTKE